MDSSRRKEGMQRIQVGLTGLAGVVLLVGLANIVVDSVRRDQIAPDASVAANTATADANSDKPSEPLAELGVTPASQTSSEPVVADLQPDPNLRKPMDRPSPAESGAQQQSQ